MIAALFVETNGCYFGLDNVDPWDKERDARKYPGPHPVVAHPPCERWGRYWGGGPMLAGTPQQKKLGDDDGCFESALASVRKWGGVIEHPEGSHAWRSFGLNLPPRSGGWVNADFIGGFTCCVEQGAYGHRARKATWLYAFGCELPTLKWGSADGKFGRLDDGYHSKEERAFHIKKGVLQRLSKKQRLATPIEFRDLLISIAATAKTTAEQCRAFASCKRASTRTLRKGEYGYHGIDIPVCKECWQWGSDHYLKAVSSTTNLPGEPDETP